MPTRILRLALVAGVAVATVPLASAQAAACTKPDEPVCAAVTAACDALPAEVADRAPCL